MTKTAAVKFGYHYHCFHYFSAVKILNKVVAVIAKHITSYLIKTVFPLMYTSNLCTSTQEGPRE